MKKSCVVNSNITETPFVLLCIETCDRERLGEPRFHKAFQNKDQDQAQVNNSYIMDFV